MEETPWSLSEALESASMRDIYYPETLATLQFCAHRHLLWFVCALAPAGSDGAEGSPAPLPRSPPWPHQTPLHYG